MLERNVEGYNLIEITNDIWRIEVISGRSFTGTFLEVVLFSVLKLGFNINEIDLAVKDMIDNSHSAAHFGMWSGFIFSFNHQREIRKAS